MAVKSDGIKGLFPTGCSSDGAPVSASEALSGENWSLTSKKPVSPVLSTTGRPKIAVRASMIWLIGTADAIKLPFPLNTAPGGGVKLAAMGPGPGGGGGATRCWGKGALTDLTLGPSFPTSNVYAGTSRAWR